MSTNDKWIDSIQTRLNACSLETLYTTIHNRYPLIIGCYQLNESQQEGGESSSSRSGELMLHSINSDLQFGKENEVKVIDTDSGVLDGKWLQNEPFQFNESSSYMYATANASGAINVYKLDEDESNDSIQLKHVCASDADADTNGLALSLAWDECNYQHKDNTSSTRIVSSYSQGSLAVHNVQCTSGEMQMEETHRWNAHTLFKHPSEVWTTCFASNIHYNTYADTVISGGDDCIMKLWDLRICGSGGSGGSNPKPSSVKTDFEAGVTAVAYHPFLEHVFAVGSYDEGLRIWDMRRLGEPLCNINVGGGVWRIKWHPRDVDRILVGAMHGGCRIVQVPGLGLHSASDDETGVSINVVKEFIEHESMAYGADWIYDEANGYEAAASCSFYDRQAFIWD